MVPFAYSSASDPLAAIGRAAEDAGVAYIAGGTDLIQLLQELEHVRAAGDELGARVLDEARDGRERIAGGGIGEAHSPGSMACAASRTAATMFG